ncbi:MAG: hypothetical protein H7249_08850 [Chitinophagaceae bacterium]|nr:hypothetical protein [Oligoflexus sp.]
MGLCLRLSCIGLFLTAASAMPSQSAPDKFRQADVCELLKDSRKGLQNEYPNEYYDCHAHSRFFKMGSLTPSSANKPS